MGGMQLGTEAAGPDSEAISFTFLLIHTWLKPGVNEKGTTPHPAFNMFHQNESRYDSKTGVRCLILIMLVAVAGVVANCSNKQIAVKDFDAEESSADADVKTGVKPVPDAQVAVIETSDYGVIILDLYPNIAPKMVERFKKLIQEGFYDGTTFHRVNADAGLIQGGDPLSKDSNPANDGSGDSPYPNVPAELSDIPFDRGTVGAARRGAQDFAGRPGLTEAQARDTANCQFFITLKAAPDLDEDYTVFGKVVEGINNVQIIAGAPVEDQTEMPVDRILIKSITLQPRSKFVSAKQD